MRKAIFLSFIWLILFYSNNNGQNEIQPNNKNSITIVLIMDGLRPDAITPEVMPNLYNLKKNGVNFTNSHSAIPTVTRVNSASLATGYYPGRHGIMSNSIYIKEFNSSSSVSTSDYKNLISIDSITKGNLLSVESIGEILDKNNVKYTAISSGSPGSVFLLNHHVKQNGGYLISSEIDNGDHPAIPKEIGNVILEQFGKPPTKNGDITFNTSVDWTENVLLNYVLPTLKPGVIYNWFTEPDHSQHKFGTGSKEYIGALKNNDKYVGLLIAKLRELGLYENANIIITSDHGMNTDVNAINIKETFKSGGINPDDFVIASSGETQLLHVKDHDKNIIKKMVELLQSKDWTGAIFTEASKDNNDVVNPYGFVEGTFSLDLIHADHPERKPDILFNFRWTSDQNKYGVSGTSFVVTNGKSGKRQEKGGHGNISPACINNTLIAWGKSFKSGIEVKNPAGIVDITPTVLSLLGIKTGNDFDGRVLEEAFINGPDQQKVIVSEETISVESKDKKYKAAIQISRLGRYWYVDKAWQK
ncbi:MAG: alkaline phosphatase family protein [Chlorobi bacterium]|nr:alkaline phosphatase family protein [Chlorobiota bacterium]